MVALSSFTVARSGVSMVSWTIAGVVLVVLNLSHALPNINYGSDVSGDEVVIDQLEDYIRSHGPQHLYPLDGREQPRHHDQARPLGKYKFGVTPKDPRYYDPIVPVNRRSDLSDDDARLPYLSPDLGLLRSRFQAAPAQQPVAYQEDPIQYQDGDPVQYTANQYVQEEQYPDLYPVRDPGYGNLRHPEMVPYYGDPRLEALENLREEDKDNDGDPRLPQGPPLDYQDGLHGMRDKDVEAAEGDGDSPLVKAHQKIENDKKAAAIAATSQPEAVNYLNRSPAHAHQAEYLLQEADPHSQLSDIYFTAIVAGCTAAAVCVVIGAGMCWYRLNKSHRAAQDAEYPAYGVTGPNKDLSPSSGDRKLAQSAHMYHYQHQKQQMIALEKSSGGERHGSASDVDSEEEEGEENEYTVYECPGLAPTGEMEVKNPLFHDDPTPATPSMRKEHGDDDDDDDDDDDEDEEEQKAK